VTKLSIIIPYCNEYPQVNFTVQNLISEMEGIDAEIITIDNKSKEINPRDKAFETLQRSPYVRRGILKNIKYDEKLSHWQAKNAGIEIAKGKRLLFLDAHVILGKGSLMTMMKTKIEGSLHFPICYMLDPKKLIYRMRPEEMHYSFMSMPDKQEPFEVPVMSTCGMMIERKTLDRIGRWNKELGIYGGGENYMMYKLGTCGYPIVVHPRVSLFHFADRRGYSWNYDDYVRNTFIAAYTVGGEEWLQKLMDIRKNKKGNRPEVIDRIADDVREKCREDREYIKARQKVTIGEYFERWRRGFE